MNLIKVKNIFAAVSDKSVLDALLVALETGQAGHKARPLPSRTSELRSGLSRSKFWGTEGTVKYLQSKGFDATSVVSGFDFDGRVKSLDREIFARILADRTNEKHLMELRRLAGNTSEVESSRKPENTSEVSARDDIFAAPFDLVIVDLYPQDANNFPESMDIGGQALIRAAIKNYKNVAVAFDAGSLASLVSELISDSGSTTFNFRKTQAQKAAKFISERARAEAFQF